MGLLLHRKSYLGGGDASVPEYEFNHNNEDDDDNALCFIKKYLLTVVSLYLNFEMSKLFKMRM